MKIIIVDDENITLKWLRRIIAIIDSSYQVIESFSNGKDALEYCLHHHVDVLITDIRMPNMDGLTLLKNLTKEGVKPYTIFLSAYDDFTYAKKAITLGASDYILKPEITKEMLTTSLKKAQETLEEERKNTNTSPPFSTDLIQIIEGKKRIETEYLQSALHQSITDCTRFTIVLLKTEDASDLTRLRGFSQDFISTTDWSILHSKLDSHTLLFLCVQNKTAQGSTNISDLLASWYQTLKIFTHKAIIIGASETTSETQELQQLYTEAAETIKRQTFYTGNGYAQFKKENEERKVIVQKKIFQLYNQIINSIEKCTQQELLEICNQLFQNFYLLKIKCTLVEELSNSIILTLYRQIYKFSQSSLTTLDKINNIMITSNLDNFEQFKQHALAIISHLKSDLDTKSITCNYSQTVKKMIAYAEEHYHEKITLENVANSVNLNRTYISTLFKKETNTGYISWLMNFRLEKAAIMLKANNESINLIAENVGFMDFAYFCSKFKAKYTCTPLSYRKKNQTS